MRRAILLGVTLALALSLAPAAQAAEDTTPLPAVDLEDKCAPPCGYIYPTIGIDTDVDFPYKVSKLPELPAEVKVTLSYSWDMEQDGTGVPGDVESMKITTIISKKPTWLDAELNSTVCSFTLIPVKNAYDVCELTLSLEVTDYPVTEEALEEFGKRLMLFASSEESGTFKKSYGVEDMRFKFDQAPNVQDGLGQPNVEESPVPALAPLAAIGAAAVAAGRLRRRA